MSNLTQDQMKSIEYLDSSVNCIRANVSDESVNGVISSRDAGQINQATNIMANFISGAIHDANPQSDQDSIIFVRDTANLILSNYMLHASLDSLQQLSHAFGDLVINFAAASGAGTELSNAGESLQVAVRVRSSFQQLIARSEHVVRFFGRIENQTRMAPRISDHMMTRIREDLEGKEA